MINDQRVALWLTRKADVFASLKLADKRKRWGGQAAIISNVTKR